MIFAQLLLNKHEPRYPVQFPGHGGTWNVETYTNLIMQPGRTDLIGLRFLARHQVTFDFPKKIMDLKYSGESAIPVKASP